VLRAAWDDHERLGEEIAGLDVHTARARSESLRIALSAVDRRESLLALSGGVQEAGRTSSSPSGDGDQANPWSSPESLDKLRQATEEANAELISGFQWLIADAKEHGKPLPEPAPWNWRQEENEAWLQAREARESKTHREEGGTPMLPGTLSKPRAPKGVRKTSLPTGPSTAKE